MKFSSLIVIAALMGAATVDVQAMSLKAQDFNGADEDEIMDNVYGHYSKEGRTPSGHKTG